MSIYQMFLALTLIILTGCSTSQLIKETPTGGRVMVLGSKSISADRGLASANDTMKSKCPNGYEVTEQGWMPAPSIQPGVMVEERYFEFKCK